MNPPDHFSAFVGTRLVHSGPLKETLTSAMRAMKRGGEGALLIFDDRTGKQVDFDLRGTQDEVLARLAEHPHFVQDGPPAPRSGPGRPKLGVVAREVTLLPRHWEWLEQHPGGISVTLRKLVDEARKREPGRVEARAALEAAGKFMWSMAGDLPGFEEASRALYAGDRARLVQETRDWPADVRDHLFRMAAGALKAPLSGE